MQTSRGTRRGLNFTVRITPQERAVLELIRMGSAGPRPLGPWLLWNALQGHCQDLAAAVPELRQCPAGPAMPRPAAALPARSQRVILDLFGGSGAWSLPYREAGYPVIVVTLPEHDARTYVPPANVWGILAAPPCTEFSIAKNGQRRDLIKGMEGVNAVFRLVWQCQPQWWALENPGSGLLAKILGIPADSFQPYEFGDPWTKRTALWGKFALPARGPFVTPITSAMKRGTAAARSITPPGFARAFFNANQ